ncbi:MAG: ABC transporter ATP-binding protein [Nitrososphaerota archaeon]
MAKVRADRITKVFKTLKALDDVSVTIDHGLFFCLLGPSGSGKTTLMRIIAGLETPTRGSVFFDDEDVTELSPSERNIAMVFQFPSIYPSLNIYDNIALAIRREVNSKQEERDRVRWAASLLRIEEHLNKRYHEIDFGILQRVSIAKAIVRKAQVYIFDEPLSNLDTKLRESLRSEFQRIHKEVGGTFIYVTHDQLEAMAIADKIGVLRDGKLYQVGTPDEIYYHPVNKFVAYFIGSPTINFVDTKLKMVENKLYAYVGDSYLQLGEESKRALQSRVDKLENLQLGIRPHDISISTTPVADSIPCYVNYIESLGTSLLVELKSGSAAFKCLCDATINIKEGMQVYAVFDKEHIHIIDPETEEVII